MTSTLTLCASLGLAGAPAPSDSSPSEPAAKTQAVQPYRGDALQTARRNDDFRRVLYTGPNAQLVVMSLQPQEDIGIETHDVDQCFFIVQGEGKAVIAGETSRITDESVICIPAGTRHNFVNTGEGVMKLFTVYSPAEHPPGTVHRTKADARKAEAMERED